MTQPVAVRPPRDARLFDLSAVSTTPRVRPLSAAERLPVVDVLRGVAILGVLVAYAFWNLGRPPADTWRVGERTLDTIADMLVDTKFITIFAFLFGLGTSQQWRRVEKHGQSVAVIHARRMLFLLVVGVLHATALRNGDILAPYALVGMALLAARRRSNTQLAIGAVVLALVPYAVMAVLYVADWRLGSRPSASADTSWLAYWRDNLTWLRYWYASNPLLEFPRILALMIAGVLADRGRWIARLAADGRLARRALAIALPLAIVFRGAFWLLPKLWASPHLTFLRAVVFQQTYYFAAWSLAAVYVAAAALLCQRPRWSERLSWLRAVGRMAFTNYLLQAALIVPFCLAIGAFDHVTPANGLALSLGVMAIQIPFSVWWLERHAYGPVETLWRRVTYGR